MSQKYTLRKIEDITSALASCGRYLEEFISAGNLSADSKAEFRDTILSIDVLAHFPQVLKDNYARLSDGLFNSLVSLDAACRTIQDRMMETGTRDEDMWQKLGPESYAVSAYTECHMWTLDYLTSRLTTILKLFINDSDSFKKALSQLPE